MQTRTVLVVDDEPLFRSSVLDRFAARYPHLRLMEAGDGQSALEVFQEASIDVLITDVQMPRMSGIQLLSQLQKMDVKTRTIVVTAFGGPELRQHVETHHGLLYLEKPVDLPELEKLVIDLLGRPTGQFTGLSLSGFMQLLNAEGATATLKVMQGDLSGHLIFVDGILVDAFDGQVRGEEAALDLLTWRKPFFELAEAAVDFSTTVHRPVTELLLEAARLEDEATQIQSDIPTCDLFNALEAWKEASFDASTPQETDTMANVKATLSQAMNIEGAIGVALVDFESGLTLGTEGGGTRLNLEVAGAGNLDVVRAKMNVMKQLGLDDKIEDILITLGTQYHLIRPLDKYTTMFLYLAIDRDKGNLGMARHQLKSIENDLVI